jgi:hypothetical protein
MILNVRHCARCNGEHITLRFTPLANPPDGITHWSMCPQVHQPILLTVTKKDGDTTTLTTSNAPITHGDLTHGATS